jgi:hypothetical protein
MSATRDEIKKKKIWVMCSEQNKNFVGLMALQLIIISFQAFV